MNKYEETRGNEKGFDNPEYRMEIDFIRDCITLYHMGEDEEVNRIAEKIIRLKSPKKESPLSALREDIKRI